MRSSWMKASRFPDLRAYDALWVMGGPMDVWDVEDNPWLIPEKRAIRQWVRELKRPFLGICLGHQLLADSVGGTCGPQRPPEVGIMEVSLTEEGKRDPVFARQPHTAKALQWHGVRVAQPPEDAVVLASSPACRVQAMRVGDRAWSAQYHVELEDNTITAWGCVPEYAAALEKTHGAGALQRMADEAEAADADLQGVRAAAVPGLHEGGERDGGGEVANTRSPPHQCHPGLEPGSIVEPLVRRMSGSRRCAWPG